MSLNFWKAKYQLQFKALSTMKPLRPQFSIWRNMHLSVLHKAYVVFHNLVEKTKRCKFSTPLHMNYMLQQLHFSLTSPTLYTRLQACTSFPVSLSQTWLTTVSPGVLFLPPIWEHPSPKHSLVGQELLEGRKWGWSSEGQGSSPAVAQLDICGVPGSQWSPADAISNNLPLQNWVPERYSKKNFKTALRITKHCCRESSHMHRAESSSLQYAVRL